MNGIHDEALQSIDVVHVFGEEFGELLSEERLLVLADAALDVRVDDPLQSHGEGVEVALRFGSVRGYELAQFLLHVHHRLAGELDRRYFFRVPIGHFEPTQYSRQWVLYF